MNTETMESMNTPLLINENGKRRNSEDHDEASDKNACSVREAENATT